MEVIIYKFHPIKITNLLTKQNWSVNFWCVDKNEALKYAKLTWGAKIWSLE